jgi:hypothetical protein
MGIMAQYYSKRLYKRYANKNYLQNNCQQYVAGLSLHLAKLYELAQFKINTVIILNIVMTTFSRLKTNK